jgi:hypothetical protein
MDSACLENILRHFGIKIMSTPVYPVYNNTIFVAPEDTDLLQVGTLHELTKTQQPKLVPDATFEDDPVALSITSYLIWKNQPHRRWVPVNEVGRVTPEAREMAHDLRKYFLHRSTMKVLQGQTPTEFQYKLNAFLSDIRPLKIDELGMLYRLPYFWQEDLALDQVFEGASQIDLDGPAMYSVTTHTQLTPVREVFKSRKSGDFVQFWFQDTDGHRALYEVKSDNKLISVFRSLYRQPSLQVKAQAQMQALRGSHIRTRFWRLSNLELE